MEFQNNEITVKIKKKPKCWVEMEVTVSPEATVATYQKAVKNICKEVSLPGFRKGKAPEAMVIANFASPIEKEWKHLLSNLALVEGIRLSQIRPLNHQVESAQLKSCSQTAGSHLHYSYESEPLVPEISLDGIVLHKVEPSLVTPQKLQEQIENIRYTFSEWKDIEGRPIQENDYVVLDIEKLDEPRQMICSDQVFDTSPKHMGGWIRTLIIGKNVGDVVEGTSERSTDQPEGTPFIPTRCRITVKKIRQISLPDDVALAEKSGAKDIAHFQEMTHKQLQKHAEEEAHEQLKEQLTHILLEKYAFDLPETLLKAETQFRVRRKLTTLQQDISQEKLKTLQQELAQSIPPLVEKQMRLFFLMKKVAEQNNFEISKQELMIQFAKQLSGDPQDSFITPDMKEDELRSRLLVSAIINKGKEFLLSKVTIV